jgi:diphthamide biosynthesis protein 3
MTSFYDEIEIEDMDWSPALSGYTYSCPCGDLFFISLDEMINLDEEIATCPSCSLILR